MGYFRDKKLVIFFGLIILFLILRFTVLFSSPDKIYHGDELYIGTITREIICGPLLSLWEYLDYKIEYFPGGTLIVGILAVPFFLLFGQTYISLKLVGLAFATGTFILWYLFLDKFFNRKTAVTCALLFIFSMPFYTKISLSSWGAHPESNFFTILSIFIFYFIFFRGSKQREDNLPTFYKNNTRYLFVLGLVAGFSLWFIHTYLITLMFLLLFWFTFDRRFILRKALYIFSIGFLLGFSPAIYYGIFYRGAIFNIYDKSILSELVSYNFNNFFPKLFSLLNYYLPQSFLFERFLNLDGKLFSYLYYFIFLLAFISLLWINKHYLFILLRNILSLVTLEDVKVLPWNISKDSLILMYPLIFLFIYSLSSFSIIPQLWGSLELRRDYNDYRYMIPIIPFIFAVIAIFLERLEAMGRKILPKVLLTFMLFMGLIGNLNLVLIENFGKLNKDKGYSYNVVGRKLGLRPTGSLAGYAVSFEKLDKNLRLQFYEGLGAGIAWKLRQKTASDVIKIIGTEIKPAYQPYCYRGWGTIFFLEGPKDFNKKFEDALYTANNIPWEYRTFFYEGIGRSNGLFEDMDEAVAIINKMDKAYRPFCYSGLGYRTGFSFKHAPDKRLNILSKVGKEYEKFFYQGLRVGMEER